MTWRGVTDTLTANLSAQSFSTERRQLMPQWLIRHRWLGVLVVVLIALFAFAACGDDDEEETPGATTPAAYFSVPA